MRFKDFHNATQDDLTDAMYWFCKNYNCGNNCNMFQRFKEIEEHYQPSSDGPRNEESRIIYDEMVRKYQSKEITA
jgi:hypothetical protein